MGICASQPEVADETFEQVNSYVYKFKGGHSAADAPASTSNAAEGSVRTQSSPAAAAAAAATAAGTEEKHLDVVLVHGLQLCSHRLAYYKTWQKREGGAVVCSLPECIAKDYPHARVLSISYNSTAFGSDVMSSSWEQIADQVCKHLADDYLGLHPPLGSAPLFLVGHSLGGLMIKQLCLELQRQHPKVFERIEGVVFYATPHLGSWFANKLECVLTCLPGVKKSGVLAFLRVLSEDTAILNNDFDNVRHPLDSRMKTTRSFQTYAILETGAGTGIGCLGRIVENAAAAQGVDRSDAIEGAYHEDICKPSSATDSRYRYLHSFIAKQTKAHQEQRQRQQQLDECATAARLDSAFNGEWRARHEDKVHCITVSDSGVEFGWQDHKIKHPVERLASYTFHLQHDKGSSLFVLLPCRNQMVEANYTLGHYLTWVKSAPQL